jgi:hypothetical protein
VEGAARAVVFAGFLELYPPVDDIDDIDTVQQVIDEGLGYASGHAQLCAPKGRNFGG